MLAEMARQDQLANDLANASTPGYKADRVSQRSFGDLMLSNSADGSTVGPLGQGAAIDKQADRPAPAGAASETGQPLDLAVAGDGYFGVQTKQGVRYTRNGSFAADAKGDPRRPDGQPGPRRGRQADRRSPTARSTRPRSRSSTSATRSSRATPTSPARPAARRPGTIKSGSLEGSGVDPARAMVDLMASMRSMEATQRAITTIDTSLQQTASQVGGLPG